MSGIPESIIHGEFARITDLRVNGGEPKSGDWPMAESWSDVRIDWDGLFEPGPLGLGDHDSHFGPTRITRGYQVGDNRKGQEFRNDAQISLAQGADIDQIAQLLGIPELLGHDEDTGYMDFMVQAMKLNMLVVPAGDRADHDVRQYFRPGTRLYQKQDNQGVVLKISEANLPCVVTGGKIFDELSRKPDIGRDEFADKFVRVAYGYRGWIASVDAVGGGVLSVGDVFSAQLAIDTAPGMRPPFDSKV